MRSTVTKNILSEEQCEGKLQAGSLVGSSQRGPKVQICLDRAFAYYPTPKFRLQLNSEILSEKIWWKLILEWN
mgnify:CR=1 FL=1